VNPGLRRGTRDDLPRIVEIYNHYVEQSVATFDTTIHAVADREAWFEEFGADRHQLFVLEEAGRVIGYAYSGRMRPRAAYDRSVETTIYLAPAAVGRGLGEPLYRHLLDALARTDVHRAYGVVTVPNPGSIALHERLGFAEVGRLTECGHKFGRWWDVVWLERPFPET
jgi:phosphinothricin acetyltransferase